jgi:hypothetical protein
MQHPRFVFLALSAPADEEDGPGREATAWMLVSPNNRPLGQGERLFGSYAECRAAVLRLRAHHELVTAVSSAVEATGHWIWRVELDGAPVAVSSRSYLRSRECHYNLERFLEAVPTAQVVTGTRAVRGGRQRLAGAGAHIRLRSNLGHTQ